MMDKISQIFLPTHFGGLPIQTPLSEQCRVDPVPPSILCPFTQEYWTVDGDVLLTMLKTGCSGSPHMVESEMNKIALLVYGKQIYITYNCNLDILITI